MSGVILYDDEFGAIVAYPETGILEIRWYDTTAGMTGEQFNAFLAEFATKVEETVHDLAFVDAVQFAMPMERMDSAWRDAKIIPRYNAARLKKFAFLMPQDSPMIGTPPAAEGPGRFPTGYFGSRSDAFDWLTS